LANHPSKASRKPAGSSVALREKRGFNTPRKLGDFSVVAKSESRLVDGGIRDRVMAVWPVCGMIRRV
jgi:hypothetical protein